MSASADDGDLVGASANGDDGPDLAGALEAILLVVDEPVTVALLAEVTGASRADLDRTLRTLAAEYTDARRGFELREVGAGWRLYTRAVYADLVERFVLDGQRARLSQAALETLAVVAYRQPVSRARVSAVRGVSCDGVLRTLGARGLVTEVGTEPESGALLYGTTPLFLEKLGLTSTEDLPELAPHLPDLDALSGADTPELDAVAPSTPTGGATT